MNQRNARLWARLPACQRCNRSDCQCRQAGCLSHFDLPASRRDFLRGAAAMSALAFVGSASGADEPPMSLPLVGYNEHRSNLPGGRHANVSTNRAMVVKADGTDRRSDRRSIGGELVNEAGTGTQFAGWSPDGKTAVVLRGWECVENAQCHALRCSPGQDEDGRSASLARDFRHLCRSSHCYSRSVSLHHGLSHGEAWWRAHATHRISGSGPRRRRTDLSVDRTDAG